MNIIWIKPKFELQTFCKALDDDKEVRAFFYDISKAFERSGKEV